MNLLVTHREIDLAGYELMAALAKNPDIKIYITASTPEEVERIKGDCVPVMIPPLKSKIVFKAIKALRRIIKQYEVDFIYSPSSAGLSNALLASSGLKTKNLGYRGTQAKVRKSDPTYYLGVLNPRLTHLFCATEDTVEYMSGFISRDKISFMPKPFELSWVEEACKNPKKVDGIPEGAFKLINIAVHKDRPYKGLTDLLNAFYLVDDPRLHLTVIGSYGESDALLAAKGVEEGRIHLLGLRNDAINYIPTHDLYVLPSWRDAEPRVVKEAMACGVPCIVTDIPGARILIKDNVTGKLCSSHNPEKMAETIKMFMNDPVMTEQYGKASREFVRDNYRLDKCVKRFENVLYALDK